MVKPDSPVRQLPNPAAPECLNKTYADKPAQKGGTIIAEEVLAIDEHLRRMADPDEYRPPGCPYCARNAQVHDIRWRKLRDQPGLPEVAIRRYRCRPCHAVWQVLPAFIARYLHRTWEAVQSAVVTLGGGLVLAVTGFERRVTHKPSTLRRWLGRLGSCALVLVHTLLATRVQVSPALLGPGCTRAELVEALASTGVVEKQHKLLALACWIHRLVPGLRLM